MKKPPNTTSKLWNKLSEQEQKDWVDYYEIIKRELSMLHEAEVDIEAHTLAYELVWMLRDR